MIKKMNAAEITPGMIVNQWDYNWRVLSNDQLVVTRPMPGQTPGTGNGVLTVEAASSGAPHGQHKIQYGEGDQLTTRVDPSLNANKKPVASGPDM